MQKPIRMKSVSSEEQKKQFEKRDEQIRLFQVYMIEIGQWKMVNGQVTTTGTFKEKQEIEDGFKAWLKKERN